MTEERLKEIEARAASFAWDILTFRHGEELNGIIRLDIPELVAALREARELLGALVALGPPWEKRPFETYFTCCDSHWSEGHEPNCPWLAAKQYLEPTPQ